MVGIGTSTNVGTISSPVGWGAPSRGPRPPQEHVPQAETVLEHLFGLRAETFPSVYYVTFRDSDGSVGRRDFATHWIHWYPAKMFHRIPQAILASLPAKTRLVILDPFCGSGTVLLEGIRRGHDTIGIDVNPVARLISRVKTKPIHPRHLRRHIAAVLRRTRQYPLHSARDATLDYWFKPRIRAVLHNFFYAISQIPHAECREFFEVCFSSIIRQASFADPRIPPPVRLNAKRATTANRKYQSDLKRAQRLRVPGVYELFTQAIEDNLRRVDELYTMSSLGTARVLPGEFEAANTGLPTNSVDLVLTSPPYCGAQKYARSLRLEMLMMNIPPEEIAATDRRTLGTERITKTDVLNAPMTPFESLNRLISTVRMRNDVRATMLAHYCNYMYAFGKELARVLKPNGNAFVTFGTDRISGLDIQCAEIFAQAAIANGLRHVATLVDAIPSRGMITRRHATAATIAEEHVVWIQS